MAVPLSAFQPTVKKQTVASAGFPWSCLYTCVLPCATVCVYV